MSKQIAIKDELYESMSKMKGEKSFSELLEELINNKGIIQEKNENAPTWVNNTFKENIEWGNAAMRAYAERRIEFESLFFEKGLTFDKEECIRQAFGYYIMTLKTSRSKNEKEVKLPEFVPGKELSKEEIKRVIELSYKK